MVIISFKKVPIRNNSELFFNILSILLFQHKISKCTSDSTVFLSNAFIRNPLF